MRRHTAGGDLLAIAFGTTIAMWAILYIAAMPPGYAALRIMAAVAIVVCLFAAGFTAGRCGHCEDDADDGPLDHFHSVLFHDQSLDEIPVHCLSPFRCGPAGSCFKLIHLQ